MNVLKRVDNYLQDLDYRKGGTTTGTTTTKTGKPSKTKDAVEAVKVNFHRGRNHFVVFCSCFLPHCAGSHKKLAQPRSENSVRFDKCYSEGIKMQRGVKMPCNDDMPPMQEVATGRTTQDQQQGMWGVGPFGSMPYNYGGGMAGQPGAMSAATGMQPYGPGYGMPYMQVASLAHEHSPLWIRVCAVSLRKFLCTHCPKAALTKKARYSFSSINMPHNILSFTAVRDSTSHALVFPCRPPTTKTCLLST
jgi:hypothetical protein